MNPSPSFTAADFVLGVTRATSDDPFAPANAPARHDGARVGGRLAAPFAGAYANPEPVGAAARSGGRASRAACDGWLGLCVSPGPASGAAATRLYYTTGAGALGVCTVTVDAADGRVSAASRLVATDLRGASEVCATYARGAERAYVLSRDALSAYVEAGPQAGLHVLLEHLRAPRGLAAVPGASGDVVFVADDGPGPTPTVMALPGAASVGSVRGVNGNLRAVPVLALDERRFGRAESVAVAADGALVVATRAAASSAPALLGGCVR